jgi:hypothetical protein
MMNKPEPNLIKQLNSPGWNLIEEQSDKRTTGTLSEVLTESHSRKSEGRSPGKIEQIETAIKLDMLQVELLWHQLGLPTI